MKIIDVGILGYTVDVQFFYFLLVISKYVMQRIRTRVAKLKHTCIKCVYKSSFEVLLHVILFLRWKETKTVRLFPTWFKHICLIICNYFLIRMQNSNPHANSYMQQATMEFQYYVIRSMVNFFLAICIYRWKDFLLVDDAHYQISLFFQLMLKIKRHFGKYLCYYRYYKRKTTTTKMF